jgi:hypothetical protein
LTFHTTAITVKLLEPTGIAGVFPN